MTQVVGNYFSWKTRSYPFYLVNIMGADHLATQGARASATMILILLNQDYSVPACLELRQHWQTKLNHRQHKSNTSGHSGGVQRILRSTFLTHNMLNLYYVLIRYLHQVPSYHTDMIHVIASSKTRICTRFMVSIMPHDNLVIKETMASRNTVFNTLRSRQNGCQFPDRIFKGIFLNENVGISIQISLKFIP